MRTAVKLSDKAHHLRTMVLEVMRRAGAGHIATSFSCADIITALYYGDVLRVVPDIRSKFGEEAVAAVGKVLQGKIPRKLLGD